MDSVVDSVVDITVCNKAAIYAHGGAPLRNAADSVDGDGALLWENASTGPPGGEEAFDVTAAGDAMLEVLIKGVDSRYEDSDSGLDSDMSAMSIRIRASICAIVCGVGSGSSKCADAPRGMTSINALPSGVPSHCQCSFLVAS
jgi:hypothetical protein